MTPPASERWRRWDRLLVAIRGGCPACGGPGAFRSLYALRERCAHCGVRFQRDAGSWLGAAVIAYGFAIAVSAIVGWLIVARAGGLGGGVEWWLVATGLTTVLLVYRPAKGGWTWFLWVAGRVHRDGEDPERSA